jgi:hypothetical protein
MLTLGPSKFFKLGFWIRPWNILCNDFLSYFSVTNIYASSWIFFCSSGQSGIYIFYRSANDSSCWRAFKPTHPLTLWLHCLRRSYAFPKCWKRPKHYNSLHISHMCVHFTCQHLFVGYWTIQFQPLIFLAINQYEKLLIVRLTTYHHDDPLFDPRSGHVGFVMDRVALGRIFSKYFGFPVDSHSTNCSTFITHSSYRRRNSLDTNSVVKYPTYRRRLAALFQEQKLRVYVVLIEMGNMNVNGEQTKMLKKAVVA